VTYTKTKWVDDVTPIDAVNLNNMEDGISDNKAKLDIYSQDLTNIEYDISNNTNKISAHTLNLEGIENDLNDVKGDLTDATDSILDVTGSVNDVTDSISKLSKETIVLDVGDNLYNKKGTTIDEIRNTQSLLHSLLHQKITDTAVAIKGICQGDSTTYGVGIDGDGTYRAPDTVLTPSGAGHVEKRANVTYPEKLQESLRAVYGTRISIVNWGYEGDNMQMGYEKWNKLGTGVIADFAIVNYGINDAIGTWNPYYNNITKYIQYLEKCILNHTLCNRAVFILLTFKQKSSDNLGIKTFINALITVAQKYNLPVIDGLELAKNQSYNIINGVAHDDENHFNSTGYSIFGSRIATKFIADCKTVNSGDALLIRPTIDSIKYITGCTSGSRTDVYTPNETGTGGGIYCYMAVGAKLIYTFENSEENLIACPLFYLDGVGEIKITLDFGCQKAQYTYSNGITYPNTSTVSISTSCREISIYKDGTAKGMIIPTTGIHSLTIETTGICFFQGVKFLNLSDIKSENKMNSFVYGETSGIWTRDSVASTTIIMDKVYSLGYFNDNTYQYRHILLKLTLHNYDKTVREYVLDLPVNKCYLLKETTLNPTTESIADRTLTSITISDTTLTLNWGGDLTVPSSFIIKIL